MRPLLVLAALLVVPGCNTQTKKVAAIKIGDKCPAGWLGSSNGYESWGCENGVIKDITKETQELDAKDRKYKADLVFALRSRILTDKEMAEVGALGTYLFITPMVVYRQEEVDRKFNDALAQQFRLRAIQAEIAKPTEPVKP